MTRNCLSTVIACIVLASSTMAMGQVSLPAIPTEERILNGDLPLAGNPDSRIQAFALDGQVCVLALENFQVRALRSTDGGQTFGSEIEVAGGTNQQRVLNFRGALSADGVLYAGLTVVDPAGGVGLSTLSSPDLCQTWTTPIPVVQNGDPAHGIYQFHLAIDAGPPGVVAIAFWRFDAGHYATVSQDSGESWTEPTLVSVNPGPVQLPDIVVDDATGHLWIGFLEEFSTGVSCAPCSFPTVRRSTDLGANFDPPTYIDFFSDLLTSIFPRLLLAKDGSLLLTSWVADFGSFPLDKIVVARSTDGGQTFQEVLREVTGGNFDTSSKPRLTRAADDGTILLTFRDGSGRLGVNRSTSNGATFGARQLLSGSTAVQDSSFVLDHDVARTAAGNWVIAWRDAANSSVTSLDDILARASTDGGATWGPTQQVNSPVASPGGSESPVVVPTGDDGVLVGFLDSRETNGLSLDVLVSRSTASDLSFGPDERIDMDLGSNRTHIDFDVNVASDGLSGAHVAFLAKVEGARNDLFVTSSTDGGRTFATPVRVSTQPPGSRSILQPVLGATPDGHVYAIHLSAPLDTGPTELRFNRSTDFGSSWLDADQFLGIPDFPRMNRVSLAVADGGRVWIAWDAADGLHLARSSNGGLSFVSEIVDGGLPSIASPDLCASGDTLFLAFVSGSSVYTRVSTDGGVSFTAPVIISTQSANEPAVDCVPGARALVVWRGRGSSDGLFASRFDGVQWSAPTTIASDPGPNVSVSFNPTVAYTDLDGINAVVAYSTRNTVNQWGFYATTSDGGATFSVPQGLGGASANLVNGVRSVSDRMGNAWISWLDARPYGARSPLVQRSVDGGATFGQVYRLETVSPGNTFWAGYDSTSTEIAALPGAGLFVWVGQRASTLFDALFNVDDIFDSDRDGRVALCHTPPGNQGNRHTIVVGPPAVPAHLAHGDPMGACLPAAPAVKKIEKTPGSDDVPIELSLVDRR